MSSISWLPNFLCLALRSAGSKKIGCTAARIAVAIATGKLSKMMNNNSSWTRPPLTPCDNSATLKADRPIIKRIAVSMHMMKVRRRLACFPGVWGRKMSLGQRTAPNKKKKTVRETTWKVNPAMTMAAPGVTPVVSTGSETETPPPAAWIINATTSLGIKTRAYSLGFILKTPRPTRSAMRPIQT